MVQIVVCGGVSSLGYLLKDEIHLFRNINKFLNIAEELHNVAWAYARMDILIIIIFNIEFYLI